MKKCEQCGVEFSPVHGNHKFCSRKCGDKNKVERGSVSKSKKVWLTKNPEYNRRYHLQRTFGITVEQYNEILESQDNCCAICKRTPEEEKRSFAIDHDHDTGEIFGALCWTCNHKFVGKRRDPTLYERAADYLRKGTGLFVPDEFKKGRKKRRRKKRN